MPQGHQAMSTGSTGSPGHSGPLCEHTAAGVPHAELKDLCHILSARSGTWLLLLQVKLTILLSLHGGRGELCGAQGE